MEDAEGNGVGARAGGGVEGAQDGEGLGLGGLLLEARDDGAEAEGGSLAGGGSEVGIGLDEGEEGGLDQGRGGRGDGEGVEGGETARLNSWGMRANTKGIAYWSGGHARR